jgi:protein-L-isoaspartate(D-aspartate) O-methyltransferase
MDKLQQRETLDSRVVQAMASVPRHLFVDSALAPQAYEDTSLPIGLGQTISKPSVVARMLSLLLQQGPAPLGRVLEIGTGCGYQAAVLACLVREVYSVERLHQLHAKARANVRPLLIGNLHLLLGDGMLGFAKGAPYDAIISAAGGDKVPEAWIDQLALGGCIIAPTVKAHAAGATTSQYLLVVRKTSQGLVSTAFEAVQFVPLKSGIA